MVKEAEENAETDKILRENVESKNQLESYLYSVRTTVQDTLKDKISEEDKATLEGEVTRALSWLEEHSAETKAVYDEKRKQVESVANPVISTAYTASGGSTPGQSGSASTSSADAANDSSSGGGESGPTVEEVD